MAQQRVCGLLNVASGLSGGGGGAETSAGVSRGAEFAEVIGWGLGDSDVLAAGEEAEGINLPKWMLSLCFVNKCLTVLLKMNANPIVKMTAKEPNAIRPNLSHRGNTRSFLVII
jgi:hypothetical protein